MTESEFYKMHHKPIYTPHHPHASKNGTILEHRLKVEKDIGRYLFPSEIVHHHYNWDGSCYFVVFKNKAEHTGIHTCEEALRYSGHYNWRKCNFCKEYDDPKNLTISKSHVYHKKCAAKDRQKQYSKSAISDERWKELRRETQNKLSLR